MFEKRSEPMLSRVAFIGRSLRFFIYSLGLLFISLGIGMLGYAYFADLNWVDAFLNASMILTGMDPDRRHENRRCQAFAGFYALFSGVAFLSIAAVLFAPIAHRFLHALHLDDE
ncbi:MAG: hypothetical protein IPJ74_15120 [Saprospiraceae bacterium]|nr:hypothetical protein [Saprospiraceae bacterium]